jgi:hypothetical protein
VLKGKDGNLYFIDTIPHSVEYMQAGNGAQTEQKGHKLHVNRIANAAVANGKDWSQVTQKVEKEKKAK